MTAKTLSSIASDSSGSPPPRLDPSNPRHVIYGLLIALLACFGVSAAGGLLTASSVGTWYQLLERPSWNPPGWVFGPVWTTLYAMMAVAVWRVWRVSKSPKRSIAIFATQLTLNLLWSALFFGLRSPGLALVEILLLVAMIVITIADFRRWDGLAAALLLPYLLWTSFATVLNGSIYFLNR